MACSLAAAGPVVRLHVQWTAALALAPLALADQLPLSMIVMHGWSGFPVSRAV